jgi:surface carbohydrate biosynthesis protein (TIGR04326 family)
VCSSDLGLHDLLEQQNLRTDWIWIYNRSQQLDYAASVRLRDEFDRGAGGKNHHYLLHEFLTPAATIRALLGLAELYLKALRVSAAARRAFHFEASAMNLFPVLAEDWRASMYGKPAIDHLFYAAAFRELARRLRSTRALYVWENQAWEKALIVACQEDSTAKTIGCQHATVPPLDVRSFPAGRGDVMPDVLAVNGAAARDEMLKTGFPPARLRTVTALRYSHLAGLQGSQVRVLPPQQRTLLVVGGIMATETGLQSDLLQEVTSALGRYDRCIVKPHTFCKFPLRESALPIAVEFTERPLAELWHMADVVYCANSTSAAIEAAWLGLPLIVAGAGDGMNLSPLFGWPGMEFATDAETLAKQLEDPNRLELPPDYFCLDDGLASWNETLRAQCED